MEGSGENWPSDSDLEVGDDVNDFYFDDEEFPGDGESHSFAETVDPMMGESETNRKGRQREVTERLIELSATIPGLKKKMDNTSILDKASNYVKQLQERVRDLEQEVESHICSNKGTAACEVNSDDYYQPNDILPEIDKASVLQEAINYVKQLKERIEVLEKETNKGSIYEVIDHQEITPLFGVM